MRERIKQYENNLNVKLNSKNEVERVTDIK